MSRRLQSPGHFLFIACGIRTRLCYFMERALAGWKLPISQRTGFHLYIAPTRLAHDNFFRAQTMSAVR